MNVCTLIRAEKADTLYCAHASVNQWGDVEFDQFFDPFLVLYSALAGVLRPSKISDIFWTISSAREKEERSCKQNEEMSMQTDLHH
jgi:hypothetical protein